MVPVDSRRIPRVPRYSGYCYVNRHFAYGAVTRYGRSFQTVLLALIVQSRSPYPSGALLRRWFGLFPGRSPLLGESLLFSLPGGTKMFQFPPLAL